MTARPRPVHGPNEIASAFGGTARHATDDDEPCSCGRAAVVVFETERFGAVSWCGETPTTGGVA